MTTNSKFLVTQKGTIVYKHCAETAGAEIEFKINEIINY